MGRLDLDVVAAGVPERRPELFANPAITIGRTLSDTFAGIAPASAPGFVAAQATGGLLTLLAILVLYPRPRLLPVSPVSPVSPVGQRTGA